jgi:hypothetical protein
LTEKKKNQTRKEPSYEGRDEYFMDVDRFINEGMAGGSVFSRDKYTNIEEVRDLKKEAKPNE